MIYLDNAASTPLHPYVRDTMLECIDTFGNPSSIHSAGRAARKLVENARQDVAEFFNAEPEQIVFTSGGSEANMLAFMYANYMRDKDGIFATMIDHDSVAYLWKQQVTYGLENVKGARISRDFSGEIVLDVPEDALECGMASIMMRNNEVPIRWSNDAIEKLYKMHDSGCVLHCDAVQFAPHHKIDAKRAHSMFDFISISGHKMYAPKGIGALFVRNAPPEGKSSAFTVRGKQEHGLRAGTENVLGIVGLGAACRLFNQHRKELLEKELACAEAFINAFSARLGVEGELGYEVMRENGCCNGAIASYVTGVDAETLVLMCDARGVAISAGAACNSHESKPSKVLKAIGLSDDDARQTIRVSFSAAQEPEDCALGGKIVAECITDMRY